MTMLAEGPPVAPGEHVLRIPSADGDTPITWTPGVPVETDAARGAFDKMKGAGYAAYRVDGDERTQVREFDETAGKIVMMPPLQGG
jgi:hypothetical protein